MRFAVMKIHLCCVTRISPSLSLTHSFGVVNCLQFEDGYLSVWVDYLVVGVSFFFLSIALGFYGNVGGPFNDDDFSFCYLFSIELMDLQRSYRVV